jgi:hypothetical protein
MPKLLFPFYLLALSSFLLPSLANWQYKSRPDLSPPTLNITTSHAQALSPGYLFIAPYSGVSDDRAQPHGPLQPGPYIFTSAGELVWSGYSYYAGFVSNFQAAAWRGEAVLFASEAASLNRRHGHGHGHAKILNSRYEAVREVRGGNSELLDIHEFHIVDGTAALVEGYRPVPFELKGYGAGPQSQWIVDALFQGLWL